MKILESLQSLVSELKYDEFTDEAKRSFEHIHLYKKQVLRTYANNFEVKRIMAEFMILFTVDFAMNFVPLKHRETQPEFFGKVGKR